MDRITQARYNFVLAFQYCWNSKEFPIFREISVSELDNIHTGYLAIDLLDEALDLKPDFQEARALRSEIWHAILVNNPQDNYEKHYLKSKAWSETREKFFEQFGRLCICGWTATQVHHKTYDNIGKENLLTELVGLCDECHRKFHSSRNNNGKEYWDKFKAYVEENGDRLQLFPKPDLPSFYGIQIDRKTLKSEDIRTEGAVWLVAYRSATKLQASLYVQSFIHYSRLKDIKGQLEDNLSDLKWEDDKKRIGFFDDTVGHVSTADTDREFPWLHDRLISLYKIFHPHVLEL